MSWTKDKIRGILKRWTNDIEIEEYYINYIMRVAVAWGNDATAMMGFKRNQIFFADKLMLSQYAYASDDMRINLRCVTPETNTIGDLFNFTDKFVLADQIKTYEDVFFQSINMSHYGNPAPLRVNDMQAYVSAHGYRVTLQKVSGRDIGAKAEIAGRSGYISFNSTPTDITETHYHH